MISDVAAFGAYFERVYERTLEVAQAVPPARIDWRPAPGELTCGEIIRHIAATELMNMRAVASGEMRYPGHHADLGTTHAAAIAYLETCHAEAQAMLRALDPQRLQLNIPGQWQDVPGWRRLLGMIEHEIHHRSQLCTYLTLLGCTPPALFGIHVEDLPT
ncbi:MAG TPA: DinB family protein [Herpetosiphonaceae bacterium]